MLPNERVELADERRLAAERELGVNPVLQARQAQILEAFDLVAANRSYAKSDNGGPRQRPSASAKSPRARRR